MSLHTKFTVIFSLLLAFLASCTSTLYAGWVLVQRNPITIYRDTRTGLEWSVTIESAGNNNAYARSVVQQYGLRLPTWEELRDVVNNNDAIDWLDIEDGLLDLYETSNPDVLAGAFGGSISTRRPRQALTRTWIIGVRNNTGATLPPPPKPRPPQPNPNPGFTYGQNIVPEYGDRITHVNYIPIRDEDHFREVIRNADSNIVYTLIDKQTGNVYRFTTTLLPKGSATRLGIYVQDDPRGGVMVTGVMDDSPGSDSRFYANGYGNSSPIYPKPQPKPEPPRPTVGKLYVLNVWGQTRDIRRYVNQFSGEHDLFMGDMGCSPSCSATSFCAEYYTLLSKELYDKRKEQERRSTEYVNPNEHIDIVSNQKVLEMCRYISQKAGPNDVIFVYMCCHGNTKHIYGGNRRYHILYPEIFDRGGMTNPNNGIKREDIIAALKTRNHRLTVLITDSCARETIPEVKSHEHFPVAGAQRFKNNRLYTFLRSNTGFIDWNSSSPFGGYDRDGELSIVYHPKGDGSCPRGIFDDAFHSYAGVELPENQTSFSSSVFFDGLKDALAREYRRCKNDSEIYDCARRHFDNQSTQTLFDFKGYGYVIENR